jgi:hypothetical protein
LSTTGGLSADPKEYRRRLDEQPDEQIDAWVAELMRDISIRRGVGTVVQGFRKAARIDEREFERVFAGGGGAPSTIGRSAEGMLMVPAISLHYLVSGLRGAVPDGRKRLTRYLVDNFHEIVYI